MVVEWLPTYPSGFRDRSKSALVLGRQILGLQVHSPPCPVQRTKTLKERRFEHCPVSVGDSKLWLD